MKILTKNFTRRYRHIYILTKLFHEKMTFYGVCKKINFNAKIGVAWDIFLVFFTYDTKISVFRKTCHMYIECWDLRAEFLFNFFDVLKMFFLEVGAYAPIFRIKFPLWNTYQCIHINQYTV
jgi:hypothetical protein